MPGRAVAGRTHLLTRSLTHSLTHSLAHSLAYDQLLLTRSLTRPLTTHHPLTSLTTTYYSPRTYLAYDHLLTHHPRTCASS
eukprot:scaffold85610_cov30-Phaeocystis_antarctica.AAC.1